MSKVELDGEEEKVSSSGESSKKGHEEFVEKLLKEYEEQRNAIKEMIKDIEKIKEKIDNLIPKNLDARYVRIFEEKVKAITGLFSVLLDMRKEINKTLKDEIDIRRRVSRGEDVPIEEFLDVRKFAKKVEEFKEIKNKVQEKRFLECIEGQKEELKKVTMPELKKGETRNE